MPITRPLQRDIASGSAPSANACTLGRPGIRWRRRSTRPPSSSIISSGGADGASDLISAVSSRNSSASPMLRPKMTTAYGVFSRRMRRSRSVSEVLVMPMPSKSVDIARIVAEGAPKLFTRRRGERQLAHRDVDAIPLASPIRRHDGVLSGAQRPFARGGLAVDEPRGVVGGAEMERLKFAVQRRIDEVRGVVRRTGDAESRLARDGDARRGCVHAPLAGGGPFAILGRPRNPVGVMPVAELDGRIARQPLGFRSGTGCRRTVSRQRADRLLFEIVG